MLWSLNWTCTAWEQTNFLNFSTLFLTTISFEYANTPFKQIRGLATGNNLSGIPAILTMDRLECKCIYPVIKPTIYVRFVDDIGTTVQTIEEAHETLHMMNSKHPMLRFELEAPDAADFLPILDVTIWRLRLMSMAQWNGNYTRNQQIKASPWTSDLIIRVPPNLLSQQMNSTEACGVHRKNMWKTQSKQHAKN